MTGERETWSSRAAFIVAAVGSAIGFGNVWRFPSLAYQYGDGAFFIPYILALVFIGIPVLILETSIGQFYQTGDAGAFGNINKRARGLGLASVVCSFVLNSYYSALLAWVCRMFIYSIMGSDGRWRNLEKASDAYDWFLNEVTGMKTLRPGLVPTRIVWENLLCLLFVWAVVFVCLAFGVKWTGRVAYITVGLPLLILIVLVVRAATLEGAGDGVRKYIGGWNVNVLSTRGEVWSVAVTQIFFSIGVTLGIMTAYASYNKRNSPVFSNALLISLSNSFFSFLAGFAVFGVIGYIAHIEDTEIENLENIGGPALMFGTFPVALSTLPGYGHWERLLFVALFMLGIDSAFSFVEAVTTVLHDSRAFQNTSRKMVTALVCFVGFLFGLLYVTDAGFYFLDVTDFYINFMLLLVGFAECYVVGWIYGIEHQIEKLGAGPVYALMGTSFGSTVIASGVWFGVAKNSGSQPPGWSISDWSLMWGFITLIICVLVGLGVTAYLSMQAMKPDGRAEKMTQRSFFVELFMGNMLHLRNELVGVVQYIPFAWFVLIKHFIPQVLLLLFVNLAATDATNSEGEVIGSQFGNYGNYNPGYQALGIFVFCIAVLILAIGMVLPDLYACFSVQTFEDEEYEVEAPKENVKVVEASVGDE